MNVHYLLFQCAVQWCKWRSHIHPMFKKNISFLAGFCCFRYEKCTSDFVVYTCIVHKEVIGKQLWVTRYNEIYFHGDKKSNCSFCASNISKYFWRVKDSQITNKCLYNTSRNEINNSSCYYYCSLAHVVNGLLMSGFASVWFFVTFKHFCFRLLHKVLNSE